MVVALAFRVRGHRHARRLAVRAAGQPGQALLPRQRLHSIDVRQRDGQYTAAGRHGIPHRTSAKAPAARVWRRTGALHVDARAVHIAREADQRPVTEVRQRARHRTSRADGPGWPVSLNTSAYASGSFEASRCRGVPGRPLRPWYRAGYLSRNSEWARRSTAARRTPPESRGRVLEPFAAPARPSGRHTTAACCRSFSSLDARTRPPC
jgi:hypothetical protein